MMRNWDSYRDYLDALKIELEKLSEVRNDVMRRVRIAEEEKQQMMKPKTDEVVQLWLSKVQAVETEVDDLISQEIEDRVADKLQAVMNLITEGASVVADDEARVVTIPKDGGAPEIEEFVAENLPEDVPYDEGTIVGMDSIFTEVGRCLEEEGGEGGGYEGIIGLYGMGGVGKTTLLKQIYQKQNNFAVVIWVSVSKELRLEKIQEKIGMKIGLFDKVWKNKNFEEKASDILEILKEKKFVLLMDELWERVDLTKVGVPFPNPENSSKIVFTTRSLEICRLMEADRQFKMNCLADKEALELFKTSVGDETLHSYPEQIVDIARDISKECSGLPLALVSIGRALAGNKTPQEWRDVLGVLTRRSRSTSSISGSDDQLKKDIYYNLKLSYDHLQNDMFKSCLLYCCLFPRDDKISKGHLIDCWIGEGFLDDRLGAKSQGYHIIDVFLSACLLEEEEEDDNYVKMHNWIHDMTLWITTEIEEEKRNFFVCVDADLTELPEIEKWVNMTRISMTKNGFTNLKNAHVCSHLQTLFLNKNKIETIGGDFFWFMPCLKVLNLSDNELLELPSEISKLVSLQHLDLSRTAIKRLPNQLGALKKLKCLNLEDTSQLYAIPPRLISTLSVLHVLRLQGCGFLDQSGEDSVVCKDAQLLIEELFCLKNLSMLSIGLRNSHALQKLLSSYRLQSCIQSLWLHSLQHPKSIVISISYMNHLKTLRISECEYLEELEVDFVGEAQAQGISNFYFLDKVFIESCPNLRDLTWLILAPNLKHLEISQCSELEEIIKVWKLSECPELMRNLTPFLKLQILKLSNLPNLRSIYWCDLPFPDLKERTIVECPKLQTSLPDHSKEKITANVPSGPSSFNRKQVDPTGSDDIYGSTISGFSTGSGNLQSTSSSNNTNVKYDVFDICGSTISGFSTGSSNLQSTSSSNNTNVKYDVFLSFRGEDTRGGFTSHLYEALRGKKFETFIDNRLIRGDDILPTLSRVIEESKISVVIFSKDYASSKWCLRELVEIMKHVDENNQIVIPVFYGVDPSDVHKQIGSFKDSFDKHEKELPEEVQAWREALTKASNKSGWHSSLGRTDAALVLEIANDVMKRLMGQYISPGLGGLIGLERINRITSLLCLHDRTNVLIIGILGMGGIGKTTLADVIFNNNSNHFQGVCFIHNVRERLQNSGGLAALKKEILSKVLKDKTLELDDPTIPPKIKERLNRTRVFIVLDDVDDFSQMETLVKGVDGLGKGSRILITSRDRHVLQNCCVNNDNIYEVEGFDDHEALQLFRSYAFKDSNPTEDFTVLSKEFVNYAKGNPLALKVLGSSLYQKSKQEWESAVNTLPTNLDCEIYDVLKISFDGLDYREKDIFLDIAYLLKGKKRKYVAKILGDCDYSLRVLIGKSLITISCEDTIQMHDLLQEMGRRIVDNESPNEIGKRSRLWRQEDVFRTLKHDDGTNAIQGTFLDMSRIKDNHLSSQAFMNMCNLRYHSKVHFEEGLSDLSDNSRSSKVLRLWEGIMYAPKLKRLTKIPDLSESPLIKMMDISYCSSLLYFPLLAQHVNNLRDLSMWGCRSLTSFPSDIHFESLSSFDLSGCNNITKFPQISGNITGLDLSWPVTGEVPPSTQCLTKLCELNLSHCTRLKHIPTSIWKLKSLNHLNLENCSRLESCLEILDTMECLETLKLSGTAIKELPEKSLIYLSADRTAISQLPSSMKHLNELKKLSFRGCRDLRFTHSWGLLCSLRSLCLSDCNLREIPEDICRLTSLLRLDLSGNYFEYLPKSMWQLCDLEDLNLNNCKMLQSLTELPSSLYLLNASDCEQLRSIPDASKFAEIISNKVFTDSLIFSSKFAATFIFTNCLKLEAAVGNMLAQLITYLNEESFDVYRFCYSGSEVPGWFIYRTEQSSIKFGAPEWHEFFSGQLLGFAVCAVIAFEEYFYDGDSEDESDDFGDEDFVYPLKVHYKFIINNEDEECDKGDIVVAWKKNTLIDSDHVASGFLPCSPKPPVEFTNCSCEFWLSKKSPNWRVKYCGVCPIYANQNIGETSGSSASNDHREEEVEPHSKRLKP